MTKLSHDIGKQIAQLINDRETAEIMMRAFNAETPFNEEAFARWQKNQREATAALRELGIPVTS